MASLNTIIDWYRELPKSVRERMSLENLHDLSKRLDRKHVYWMPGEPDCPRDILAGNGELHTLRCKACGLNAAGPGTEICTPTAAVAAALDDRLKQYCLDRDAIDTTELAKIALSAADRIEALEAALTPSAETKAAYIGEFSFPVVARLGRDEVTRQVAVPWDTVKQIMAAIRAHAAS